MILYWGLMEEQSYPGAGRIKKKMEEQRDMMAQAKAKQPTVPTAPTADPAAGMVPGGAPMM